MQVILVRGPGRADDKDAAVAGDLQHRRSDSPGRTAGQQGLPGLHADLADDAQRGLHDGGVPGRLMERQTLGHSGPGRQQGELSIGARASAKHVVADLDRFGALTDLVHHPGGVLPDSGGQLDRTGPLTLAFTNPPVDGVHAGRPYDDAYLTGARVGLLGVYKLQNVRTAELVKAHSLHAAGRNTNG